MLRNPMRTSDGYIKLILQKKGMSNVEFMHKLNEERAKRGKWKLQKSNITNMLNGSAKPGAGKQLTPSDIHDIETVLELPEGSVRTVYA